MSESTRTPLLVTFYLEYLRTEECAAFIRSVSATYYHTTLQRLAERGNRIERRAAMLALGFVADFEFNAVLGRGLHDPDRGVRVLAESGIRCVWRRVGTEQQRQVLGRVIRQNVAREFNQAIELADDLIDEVPWFAEAWNQRAIAFFELGEFEASANDCHQALELNAYHYAAASGMAQCYLEMNDGFSALECFRRALKLNPSLEGVRAQVQYLERTLK